MIPILFNKDETTFTSLGLGEIDATVVEVERERNGIYSLYMELPFSSDYVALIEQEMQIKADAGARTKWQTFKVNRVIKDTDKKIVKVYADHISMDTINDAMKPRVAIRQQTAEGALRQWNANRISAKQYDVSSDITSVSGTTWTIDEVENARQALGGVEGSILDVWGGEYEFDNNRIILHKEMGREAPTILEYGRNIVSLEYEELIDGVYTSIYPYATYTPRSEDNRQQEPIMVTLDEIIVDGDYVGNYHSRRVQIVDFSSEFDTSGDNPEIPTQSKLRSLAKSYVKANEVGAPKITQEVDFVDLTKTLDYSDMQVMEEIELNDRVPIFYPNIKITSDVKVTKTVWQPLINQYKSITVSTIGALKASSINRDLKTSIKELEKQQKQINNTVPYLINGQGNRVWWTTPDDNMEHKIDDTWFKKNGKYTIIYKWNGSMWEEVLNDETFITEIEAEVAKAQEEAEKASQSAKDADARANEAIEKAGANANLLNTHQNTINTINTTTLPDIASSAGTALANAKSAMDEAKKADGKIADYVTKKGLVNGTTVDSKIDDATGEISRKITTVESKIPTEIGNRNYAYKDSLKKASLSLFDTDDYPLIYIKPTTNNMTAGIQISESLFEVGETYTLSFTIQNLEGGEEIYQLGGYSKAFETLAVSMDGVNYEGRWSTAPIKVNLGYSEHKVIVKLKITSESGNAKLYIQPNRGGTEFRSYHALIKNININKGTVATEWTLAPEDSYTKSEFQIFESTYDEDVKGIRSSLSALENNKLDGSTYTTFYKNEYEKTAQGLKDSYEKIGKVIDENGNTTDTFAKAVYDQNATRRTESFNEVTKDLVKEATYTAGINGLSGSIGTISGRLDKLTVGGRNYALKSNTYYYTTNYKVSEYDLSKIPKGTNIKISVWGGLGTSARTFGAYINNGNGTTSGNSQIIELTKLDGVFGQGVSTSLAKWTGEATLNVDATKVLIFGLDNNSTAAKRVEYVKVETGGVFTDWTIAPEDMLGKADFQVFKTSYEANDKLIKARLLAVDSGKEGSIAYRLNETEKTASGNTTTISDIKTKPGEQITGYQTIKERSDLYERVIGKDEAGIKSNMARMVMTDSLFKTEVIKNVPSAIGGRNYVLKSNEYYYTNNYKVAEYDLSTIPKGTKIKISLWGGLSTNLRTFGIYVNNASGLVSDNSQKFELTKLNGIHGQGVSVPLSKWTAEVTLEVDATKILVFGLDNDPTQPKRVEYVQIETGDYYTDWTAAPEDKANMSSITQLEDSISLKVSSENLLSEFYVRAEGILIKSGTNKLNITPDTTYIEDTTIKSGMIESLEADKIKTGTLDAGEVDVINIDAENITSNKTSFIQSNWNDIESSISIDGKGLLSTASDGSQVYLQNGIVGMRNPVGATVGQIGYRYASGSPQMGLYTSEGSHFSLVQRMSGNDIQTIYITNGGKEYHNSAVTTWIKSTTTNIEGELRVNNANDIRMGGGKIINPYGIHFQSGGELYSLSKGQATRLNGVRTLQIEVNGTRKMEIDETRNYMYQPLNMQGNGIFEQSDERVKTDIKPLEMDSLNIVQNIDYKSFTMIKNDRKTFGFIAQQMQDLAPNIIHEQDGLLTYDSMEYTHLIGHALQKHVTKTNDEISKLKAQIANLQDELALLKGE